MRVIVTGADGALGRAVVTLFERRAARVASLARGIPSQAMPGRFAVADLADDASTANAVADAANWLGGIDALVHLAGGFSWHETATAPLALWRTMFEANVATAVSTVTAALPHFCDSGAIVFVGAASASPAGRGMGPYAAAKSGVARLAEALSVELAPRAIRANVVLPGIMDTPRNRADMPQADPAGWTSLAAVAEVLHFLCTDASRAINGASIPVANAG